MSGPDRSERVGILARVIKTRFLSGLFPGQCVFASAEWLQPNSCWPTEEDPLEDPPGWSWSSIPHTRLPGAEVANELVSGCVKPTLAWCRKLFSLFWFLHIKLNDSKLDIGRPYKEQTQISMSGFKMVGSWFIQSLLECRQFSFLIIS